MDSFTPVSAAFGGILIGIATTLFWVANGRTAGISGIAGGILPARPGNILWRIVFLAGLPVGAWLGLRLAPLFFSDVPATLGGIDDPPMMLIVAGLLAGVGTRISHGCTSGHGICGVSLFAFRSVVAVMIFIATGAITVFVMRHVLP